MLHIEQEIRRCLENGSIALTYKATMHKLKSMSFYQLALLSNSLALKSYLSGIYLESWFSWLWGGMQKASEERRKQAEENSWKVETKKNEEYEKSQITTIYIFGFKLHFPRKHNFKKKLLIPSNSIYNFYAMQDIWNTVMIHQIWIYINIQIMI